MIYFNEEGGLIKPGINYGYKNESSYLRYWLFICFWKGTWIGLYFDRYFIPRGLSIRVLNKYGYPPISWL